MEDFVALHMTWGAANELSTLTSYHRLIAKTEHPELVNLLNAIIKDERRHFAFYRAQARMRLRPKRVGPPMTRWAMEHLWAIVGRASARRPRPTSSCCDLFGDEDGRSAALEMDRTMAELPGMGGARSSAERAAEARDGRPRIPGRAPGMWTAVRRRVASRDASGADLRPLRRCP